MKFRVWWIPQVPGEPFIVATESLGEAKFLLETLGRYDQFLLDNNIRPDYSNTGGIECCDMFGSDDNEWVDYEDEDED